MRRWRGPLLLSAVILLAQLARLSPLMDVVSGQGPTDARLVYPFTHVVFAPITLTADWLNGGGTQDLKGFLLWAAVVYVLARLMASAARGQPARDPTGERSGAAGLVRSAGAPAWRRETAAAAAFVLGLAAYIAYVAYAPRPIPRLVVDDPDVLVLE